MTETTPIKPEQAITLAKSQRQSVQRYGDDRAIQMEIKALKTALPGMAAQSDQAVAALLIAAKMSNLSPYRGEIYLVEKLGVTVASKIKQADAIAAALKRGDSLSILFYPFSRNHPLYEQLGESDLADNDVAVLCEIISSKAHTAWLDQRLGKIKEMKAMDYTRQEIENTLRAEYGQPPVYRAVGIVKATENFGERAGKMITFTRNDRARKRALTKCLNANGLAAPDQREYGPIQIADDTIESAGYEIHTPSIEDIQTQIDPEFAAAVAEDAQYADEPEPSAPATQTAIHADNQRKLGRSDEADSSAPFGGDDRPRSAAAVAIGIANSLSKKSAISASDFAQLKATWASLFQAASAAGVNAPVIDKPTPAALIAVIMDIGAKMAQPKFV
ncbi:MAG: hypothetical protein ACOYM3_01255 [Terrimicrobiaceae bacterium]